MKRIFYPESIVVIGVSERPDNLAKNIVGNLISFNFNGSIYAVGRAKGNVHGIEIHDSLDGIPDKVDLAVILTPAHLVPMFVRQCGEKGIHRIVVESGGFSEFSEEGAQLERELLEHIHNYKMRLVGPNCISVVNLETGVCLPFGIIPHNRFTQGDASIISQSGGVSLTLMGMLNIAGVGVNKSVSIGNKIDLDESDYLEYFLSDEGTRLVCLYLESISEGRRLIDIASKTTKPIIIHKANRSTASHKVAFSHTAALADDDRIVDAAFKQSGILRADDFEDVKTMAKGLSLPPVEGKDLVIISRSGGHAVTATDLAERHGFNLLPLPDSFSKTVRENFRADVISPTNPLDLGVIFDFNIYAQIVEGSLKALSPDAVLLINTYGPVENESGLLLAKQVGEIAREQNLPIALCLYADMADPSEVQRQMGFPIYDDIDAALRGLACSRDWHKWSMQKKDRMSFDLDERELVEETKTKTLSPDRSLTLCERIGIPSATWELTSTLDGAEEAAQRIGFPVALKLTTADITHKSDIGGVALSLSDSQETIRHAEQMLNSFKSEVSADIEPSFLVQEMVEDGIELLLSGRIDPTFGPVVTLGIGGIHVEIFDDVSFRVVPISRADAVSMIDELRGKKLLEGYRGGPAADREAIIDTLISVSSLLLENPDVLEFEINPLIATDRGVIAVDSRVLIRSET